MWAGVPSAENKYGTGSKQGAESPRGQKMQTKEQFGTQFAWELENIKKDLEAFLEMSRDEKLEFLPTLDSRLKVGRARLLLFVSTLR